MTISEESMFEDTFDLFEEADESTAVYNLDEEVDGEMDLSLGDQDLQDATFVMDEAELVDLLPGSQMAIVDLDGSAEEARESDWENDGDHSKFIAYLREKLMNLPPHSGQTTVGCERAIAALQRFNRDLSKAIQGDVDCAIDEDEAEEMRDTILDWIDKLEEAKDKLMGKKTRKKKSSFRIGKEVVARINDGDNIQYFISVGNEDGETLLQVKLAEPTDEQVARFLENEQFTKEAGAGITMVEDPFLHSITRLLIQSHITNGRDMEKIYANLRDKYDFTPREELSIHELLHQKGFPLIKDLGRVGEETVNPSDGNGVEHDTEYYA